MAATTGGTLLRHLIITVMILADVGPWSLCGSMGSSLESHARALKRVGRATPTAFNLVGTGASRTTLSTSHKGKRRLSLEQNLDINSTKSSKEVEILMAFKSEITGDPLRVLNSWRANDSDPCRWPGVGCFSNSKQVTALNLRGLNLVGTVSTLVGQLLNLQILDLSQNFLHGSVPASVGNCSYLLHLNMSFNEMNNDIPPQVGNLDKLQTLDLSNNYLTGGIPETLGNCSALQHLDLGVNSFTGDFPSQLGALSNLKFLSLENSSISGSIPHTLGNCSSLTELWLSYNFQRSGELPFQLGKLIHLQDFRVRGCNFWGSFPIWTLNLSSLQHLDLGENSWAGQLPQTGWRQLSNLTFLGLDSSDWHRSEIPHEIGSLTKLYMLTIENSGLVGEIPRSICNITSLQILMLHDNFLTGAIPSEIGFLRNLQSLYLSSNLFSGVLPSSLSNCSLFQFLMLGENPGFDPQPLPSWIGSFEYLTDLYFSRMNFQGEIPTEIGQLSQLGQFIAFSNNLSGVIPTSLGNCSAIYNFEVNANQLTGPIPTEIGQLSQLGQFIAFSNNLSGVIPASLGNCSAIYSFIVDENQLAGQVPPELGQLTQLGALGIAHNFLAGPFPTFIYNVTSLYEIRVADNRFNGSLSDGDFGSLPNLRDFSASNNYLEGPIPGSISKCFNLEALDLRGNTLSGEIPPGLANLTHLLSLLLGSNNFHGSIPVELLTTSQSTFYCMESLDFSDNNLDGTIPVEIGQLYCLKQLNLSANNFIGALPDSLGNFTHLMSMDLSHNRLTSSIPGEAFAMMFSLNVLNLSRNSLSGLWPLQFVELKTIVVINVSANDISGPIPLGLGGCPWLISLDLSFNRFSDAIPQDLGSLKYLRIFNASYNNFSGPIPDSGAFKANLTTASFLGNPGLCGGILGPQRLCPVEMASPMERSHCNGFECPLVWISVVSAMGFVIILLGAWYISSHRHRKEQGGDLGLVTFTADLSLRFLTKFDILDAIGAEEDSTIRRGPKSIVYKATLPGGELIAIKVLKDPVPSTIDGKKLYSKEFFNEAHTLAQLRHRNIIKVVGLYSTQDFKAILMEYMPRGTLHENLHGNARSDLTWAERFRILLGVTHGVVYLHHEFPEPIIHRDLKPTNILLDADLEPKVCDFGISKFVGYNDGDNGEVTASDICGTFGYMPPEYGTGTRVSTKGDVYSFGVVLLELLTGKPVTQTQSTTHSGQDEGLLDTVQRSFQESRIAPGITPLQVLDPVLKFEGESDAIMRQQMMLTLKLGLFCTRMLPKSRPSMNIVLEFLLEIEKIGQGAVTERTLDDILKEE